MMPSTQPLSLHRSGTHWLILALVLVFVCIHLQYVSKLGHSENGMRSAFLRWRAQLQELNEGINVWDKYAYPNPPIMALILKPFLQLPPLVGSSLWFFSKALLSIVAILSILALLDRPEHPFPTWGKFLAIGLSLRPMEGDLVHGNVNLFILFLVVAALSAFCRRHETLAGMLLGLAIACKLTPALFLAYFAWKRAWKTFLAALLGCTVFTFILPGFFMGWNNNLDYLQSWHRQMVAPYAAGIVTSEHKNQSLPGLLHRLLCAEASFSDYEGDRKIVLENHNIFTLEGTTVQGIVLACMVLFGLIVFCFCRSSKDDRPSVQLLAEFSIVVLGMLLFCERTWKHHCVTLLLPFCVASHALSNTTAARPLRWQMGITLALAGLLMLCTSSGHLDASVEAQARWGKLAQVYGAYVWMFLLMLGSMLVLLARDSKQPATELTLLDRVTNSEACVTA